MLVLDPAKRALEIETSVTNKVRKFKFYYSSIGIFHLEFYAYTRKKNEINTYKYLSRGLRKIYIYFK